MATENSFLLLSKDTFSKYISCHPSLEMGSRNLETGKSKVYRDNREPLETYKIPREKKGLCGRNSVTKNL